MLLGISSLFATLEAHFLICSLFLFSKAHHMAGRYTHVFLIFFFTWTRKEPFHALSATWKFVRQMRKKKSVSLLFFFFFVIFSCYWYWFCFVFLCVQRHLTESTPDIWDERNPRVAFLFLEMISVYFYWCSVFALSYFYYSTNSIHFFSLRSFLNLRSVSICTIFLKINT